VSNDNAKLVLDKQRRDSDGRKWRMGHLKYIISTFKSNNPPKCACGRPVRYGFVCNIPGDYRIRCPYCVLQERDGKVIEFDIHGEIRQMSGKEKPLHCFQCQKPIKRAGQRFCSALCRMQYDNHYLWDYARNWALKRSNNTCADCGGHSNLIVHHLVPVRNTGYGYNPLNVPSNLVVLCASCHGKRHGTDRKKDKAFESLPLLE